MEKKKKFTKKDTNPMVWNEFDQLIEVLIKKIDVYFGGDRKKLVIAQLHRTGGIVGSMLAIKMEVVPLLPVQFKYSYNPTKITQITSVPDILIDIPEDINFILSEGNTSTGSIGKEAAKAIKKKYPKSKIYLATLTKVFGGFETLEGIEEVFYGTMTDENFTATSEEKAKYNLRSGITIFPWEKPKNELDDINSV